MFVVGLEPQFLTAIIHATILQCSHPGSQTCPHYLDPEEVPATGLSAIFDAALHLFFVVNLIISKSSSLFSAAVLRIARKIALICNGGTIDGFTNWYLP